MFEWKVEDMVLMNQKGGIYVGYSNKKIYDCERSTTIEDKIAFVDSKQDGKLSYILSLIDKFEKDKDTLPKTNTSFGKEKIKTVSLKAWIKRNDTKYGKPIIDDWYHYGQFYFLGVERDIQTNKRNTYDIYEDLVDEVFHRQLEECEREERKYFLEHDEYSVLKTKFRNYHDIYNTSFGVHIGISSDGSIYVYDEDYDTKREITKEELNIMLDKYKQLESFIIQLSNETNIKY